MRKILFPLICVLFPAVCLAELTTDQTLEMRGFYGDYPISREASGTSWQPETTPVPGVVRNRDDLSVLYYGFINGGYIFETSDRVSSDGFTTSMFSVLIQHPVEDAKLGFRLRFSLDPLNGETGYPLLLQNGGSSNGKDRLVDRQYPQDLVSEIAATFSYPLSESSWGFFYAAYPGSPALGAPDYTTRFSASNNPVAPLSRRWLDNQMVSYGVLTAGYTSDFMKIDTSLFNGREPDQNRWNMEYEEFKLKSYSGRVAFNITPIIVWDFSVGHLSEPERLYPLVDVNQVNSFLSWNIVGEGLILQTSLGWGRNIRKPGTNTDAYIAEAAMKLGNRSTYFGRIEHAAMDHLFAPSDKRSSTVYTVVKAQFGYIYDFPFYGPSVWGIGGAVGAGFLPQTLESEYGESIAKEFIIFVRVRL